MADVEAAVISRLRGFSGLTALVPATSIVHGSFGSDRPALPRVVLERIGSDPQGVFGTGAAAVATQAADIRCHVHTKNTSTKSAPDLARDIEAQLIAALHHHKDATICGASLEPSPGDGPVDEEGEFHRMVDFVVHA